MRCGRDTGSVDLIKPAAARSSCAATKPERSRA
jgi:hypothetical protein